MKDRIVKQVMLRGGHKREGREREEDEGGWMWLVYFLHVYEYGH
jgi:hypothetical protein